MLEFMARGGMRIGDVLKLTPNDIEDRKAFIREPKSGNRAEVGGLSAAQGQPEASAVRPGKRGSALTSGSFPLPTTQPG